MSTSSSSSQKSFTPRKSTKVLHGTNDKDAQLIEAQRTFFSLGFFHDKSYGKFSELEINACFSKCRQVVVDDDDDDEDVSAAELIGECIADEVVVLAEIARRLLCPRRGTIFCIQYAHNVYLIDDRERTVEPETSLYVKPYGLFAVFPSGARLTTRDWATVEMLQHGYHVERLGRLRVEELRGDLNDEYTMGSRLVFDNIVEEALAAAVYTEPALYNLFLQQAFYVAPQIPGVVQAEHGRTFALDKHANVCVDVYTEQTPSNGLLIATYDFGTQQLYSRPALARPFVNTTKSSHNGSMYTRQVIVDKNSWSLARFIDRKFPGKIQTVGRVQIRDGKRISVGKGVSLQSTQHYIRRLTITGLKLDAIDAKLDDFVAFKKRFKLGTTHMSRDGDEDVYKPYYVLYHTLARIFQLSTIFEDVGSFERWIDWINKNGVPTNVATPAIVDHILDYVVALRASADIQGPNPLKHWFLFDNVLQDSEDRTSNVGCLLPNRGSIFDLHSLNGTTISQCYTEVNKVAGFILTKMGIPMPPLQILGNVDELDLVKSCMEAVITMHIFTDGVVPDESSLTENDLRLLTDARICIAAWYLVFKKLLQHDLQSYQFDRLFTLCRRHIKDDGATTDSQLLSFLFNRVLNVHIPYLGSFLTTIYDLRRYIFNRFNPSSDVDANTDFNPNLLNVVDPAFFLVEKPVDSLELNDTKLVYNWCRNDVYENGATQVVMFGATPVNFDMLLRSSDEFKAIVDVPSIYEKVHSGDLWPKFPLASYGRITQVEVYQGRKHVQVFRRSIPTTIDGLSRAVKNKLERTSSAQSHALALFWLLQSSVFNEAMTYDNPRPDYEKLASGIFIKVDHNNARPVSTSSGRDIRAFFRDDFRRLRNEKFNGLTNLMSTQYFSGGWKKLPRLPAEALMSAPPLVGYQSGQYSTALARSGALSNWMFNTMVSSSTTAPTYAERSVRLIIGDFLYDGKCIDYLENLMNTRTSNYTNTYDFDSATRDDDINVQAFLNKPLPVLQEQEVHTVGNFVHGKHLYQIRKDVCMKLFDARYQDDPNDDTSWYFTRSFVPTYKHFDRARFFALGVLSNGSGKPASCMPRTSEFYVPVNHYVHARINYDRTFNTENICAYSASTRGLHSRGFVQQNSGFYTTGTEAIVDGSAVFQGRSNAGIVQDPHINPDDGSYLSPSVLVSYDRLHLQHHLRSRVDIAKGTIIGRLSGEVKEVSFCVQSVLPGQSYESLERYLINTFNRDILYPIDEFAWFEFVTCDVAPAVTDYKTPHHFHTIEQEKIDEAEFKAEVERRRVIAEQNRTIYRKYLLGVMNPVDRENYFKNLREATVTTEENAKKRRREVDKWWQLHVETHEERNARRRARMAAVAPKQTSRQNKRTERIPDSDDDVDKRQRKEARLIGPSIASTSNDDQRQFRIFSKNVADPDNARDVDEQFVYSFVDAILDSYVRQYRAKNTNDDLAPRIRVLSARAFNDFLEIANKQNRLISQSERKERITQVYNDEDTFYVMPIVNQEYWGVYILYVAEAYTALFVQGSQPNVIKVNNRCTTIAETVGLELSYPKRLDNTGGGTWMQSLWYSALRLVNYLDRYLWNLSKPERGTGYNLPDTRQVTWPGELVDILSEYAKMTGLSQQSSNGVNARPSERGLMSTWCDHLNKGNEQVIVVDPRQHAFIENHSALNFPAKDKPWSIHLPFQINGIWHLAVAEVYKKPRHLFHFSLFPEQADAQAFLSKFKTAIANQYPLINRKSSELLEWANDQTIDLNYGQTNARTMMLMTMRLLQVYNDNSTRRKRLWYISKNRKTNGRWYGIGNSRDFDDIKDFLNLQDDDNDDDTSSHDDENLDLSDDSDASQSYNSDNDDNIDDDNDNDNDGHRPGGFNGNNDDQQLGDDDDNGGPGPGFSDDNGGYQLDDDTEEEQQTYPSNNTNQPGRNFEFPSFSKTRKFPIVRANEFARFIVRGFEINAQYMGNPSRYVRYTDNLDKSNAQFVRRHRRDELSYWDLESTQDVGAEKEIITIIPGRLGSEWQRLFMSGYPLTGMKDRDTTNSTFGSTAFIVPLRCKDKLASSKSPQPAASPIPIYPPRLAPKLKIVPDDDDSSDDDKDKKKSKKSSSSSSSSSSLPNDLILRKSGPKLPRPIISETPRRESESTRALPRQYTFQSLENYESVFSSTRSSPAFLAFTIKSQLDQVYNFATIHELIFEIPTKVVQTYRGPWRNVLYKDNEEPSRSNYIVSPTTDVLSLKDSGYLSNTFMGWYAGKIFSIIQPTNAIYLGVFEPTVEITDPSNLMENLVFSFGQATGLAILPLLNRRCIMATVNHGDHWVLVLAYTKSKQMFVLDPLKQYTSGIMAAAKKYRSYLERLLYWKNVDVEAVLTLQLNRDNYETFNEPLKGSKEHTAKKKYNRAIKRKSFNMWRLGHSEEIQQDGKSCGMYNLYFAKLVCELNSSKEKTFFEVFRKSETILEARSFARLGYEALWDLAMLNTRILLRKVSYKQTDAAEEKEVPMPRLLKNHYLVRVRKFNQEVPRSNGITFPLFLEFLPNDDVPPLEFELVPPEQHLQFRTAERVLISMETPTGDSSSSSSRKAPIDVTLDDDDDNEEESSSPSSGNVEPWTEINFDEPVLTNGLRDLKFQNYLTLENDVLPLMNPKVFRRFPLMKLSSLLSDTLLNWYSKPLKMHDVLSIGVISTARVEHKRWYEGLKGDITSRKCTLFIPDALSEDSQYNSQHWVACAFYPKLNCVYFYDSLFYYNENVIYNVQQARNFLEEVIHKKSTRVSDRQYLETRYQRDQAERRTFAAKKTNDKLSQAALEARNGLVVMYADAGLQFKDRNDSKLKIFDQLLRDLPLESLYSTIRKLESQLQVGDDDDPSLPAVHRATIEYLVDLASSTNDPTALARTVQSSAQFEFDAFHAAYSSRYALRQMRKYSEEVQNMERCLYCLTDKSPIRIVDAFEQKLRHQEDGINCGLYTLYYLQTIAAYSQTSDGSAIPVDPYFYSPVGKERLEKFIENGRHVIWNALVMSAVHKDESTIPKELAAKVSNSKYVAMGLKYGGVFKGMELFPNMDFNFSFVQSRPTTRMQPDLPRPRVNWNF